MNKIELKAKWGHYIDTDKLVEDMMALLTKYQHRNTEHGVCVVLDAFFTNKESLIKLLQKSEHYTGNLRVVLDEQLERRVHVNEICNCVDNFPYIVQAATCVYKETDSHGKKMVDYLKTGRQTVSIAELEDGSFGASVSERNEHLNEFDNDGFTRASKDTYRRFMDALSVFRTITASTISEENIGTLTDYKIYVGTKTSRAFNRVCHHFGVDKAPLYNKEFAKYADMVSGLTRNVKFFISVNPLDYLTMSFGVNWASCHTIDKRNIRNMSNSYAGQYCGGTMSYMLDSVSIVTYVHNAMPENYETGKVYRNMFHLGGDGVLLQGRVYPQGNDGCTDLYKEFRYIVQKELTQMLGLGANKWVRRSSVTNVVSEGCHYRDYSYNTDCNISYPSERPWCQQQTIAVGSQRICLNCGEDADDLHNGELSHHLCSEVH